MLNLANLITSVALSMGVATATPICDSKPKIKPLYANSSSNPNTSTSNEYINNYTLNLQINNDLQTNTYNQEIVNDIDTNDSPLLMDSLNYARDRENRHTISGNNNYLNVVGSIYRTTLLSSYNGDNSYFALLLNNDRNLLNDQYLSERKTTRMLYVLRIDSYNNNINTSGELTFHVSLKNPTTYDYQGDTIRNRIQTLNVVKTIYTTTQSNWDTFIGRQIIDYQAINILQTIEDPNENFYYTRDRYVDNENYIDEEYINTEIQINLTQGRTNYVMIDIVPTITSLYGDTSYPEENDIPYTNLNNFVQSTNPYGAMTILTPDNMTITGTNIIAHGNYEVIDIPGLMWEILTMPFAFVSQAFNLTLFPGTPYQLNISNLFLSIIAIVVFTALIALIARKSIGG